MEELVDYANEVRERELEELKQIQEEISQLKEKLCLLERKEEKLSDEYNEHFRLVFLKDLRIQAELGKVVLDMIYYAINEFPKKCLFKSELVYSTVLILDQEPLKQYIRYGWQFPPKYIIIDTENLKQYLEYKKQIPSLSWMIFFRISCYIYFKNPSQDDKGNYLFDIGTSCHPNYPNGQKHNSYVNIGRKGAGISDVVPMQKISIPIDLVIKIINVINY